MWMAYLPVAAAIVCCTGLCFFFCIRRWFAFYGLDHRKKGVRAANLFLAVAGGLFCVNLFSTTAILLLHGVAFSLFLDFVAFALRKCVRGEVDGWAAFAAKLYRSGLPVLLFVVVVAGYGYFNMRSIRQTSYRITSEKEVGAYRILFLTDVHYGAVQDTDVLKRSIDKMNAQKPDLVILGGDIVEEGTSKEEMQEVFRLLGGLHQKYGVYYVYGNHDRQPYTKRRTYTDAELAAAISAGGIEILEDSCKEIGEDLALAGRGDAAWGATRRRASAEAILDGVSRDRFLIMADHQPIGVEENDRQGVDLELSGHTHAGQIFPMGPLSEWMGVYNYGAYQQGNCNVIVSSGVAGWAYSIRTGERCEYVVVDIAGNRK